MRLNQKKNSQKRRLHLPPSVYLTYLLVCTLLMTGVSFSRYITTAEGQDRARVAGGGITVASQNGVVELSIKEGTSDSVTYPFTVSNEKSEVAIQYDVIVEFGEALPEGVVVSLKDVTSDPSISENTYTFSNVGIFEAGEEKINSHTLAISAQNVKGLTEEMFDFVTITVHAEQID